MKLHNWIRAFNSPFKTPIPKLYVGKLRLGVPYFFPRKKVCLNIVDLGWKTKWEPTDYRFEYGPLWSFRFFNFQIVLSFRVPEPDHYWEAWLYYDRNTDKSLTKSERLSQCMEEFKLNWIKYEGDMQIKVDYYNYVIKDKYL